MLVQQAIVERAISKSAGIVILYQLSRRVQSVEVSTTAGPGARTLCVIRVRIRQHPRPALELCTMLVGVRMHVPGAQVGGWKKEATIWPPASPVVVLALYRCFSQR